MAEIEIERREKRRIWPWLLALLLLAGAAAGAWWVFGADPVAENTTPAVESAREPATETAPPVVERPELPEPRDPDARSELQQPGDTGETPGEAPTTGGSTEPGGEPGPGGGR